ncbi:uncharacterized protein LOC103977342 isoform X3 [Musa acuminata AAA Group]|uniref:uncharacterized protein LOC103977342 isoform X3 n=1 Tax=Musa acuminata AAA Group TaxID=214697 RepID=UPI0031D1BA9D
MEAGPFGLHLTKSPSVVDVVQKILPPSGCVSCSTSFGCSESGSRHGLNPLASWCSSNKTEPTKFSASLLRIGNWEFVSRNEIDLVAKCYFAKHKLIWEVLGYRLKSKIEFHWSGIIVIKAKCCKGGHGTLDIVSKKQTMWQAAPDFTNGQSRIHRQNNGGLAYQISIADSQNWSVTTLAYQTSEKRILPKLKKWFVTWG